MEQTPRVAKRYLPGDGLRLELSLRHRANLRWVGIHFRHRSDDTAELVVSAEPSYSDSLAETFERLELSNGLRESKYELTGFVPPESPAGLYRLHEVVIETANGETVARSGVEQLGPMASVAVEVLDEELDDTEPLLLRFPD